MSQEQLLYIYAEYCPGDFFWGWWLYAVPVKDGKPDRGRYTWLNPGHAITEDVLRALDIPVIHQQSPPYHIANERAVDMFLIKYPHGALVYEGKYRSERRAAGDVPGVELWQCLKAVRESQLLDWKNSDTSYLGKREQEMQASTQDAASCEAGALSEVSSIAP